jgi:hypothetical protein
MFHTEHGSKGDPMTEPDGRYIELSFPPLSPAEQRLAEALLAHLRGDWVEARALERSARLLDGFSEGVFRSHRIAWAKRQLFLKEDPAAAFDTLLRLWPAGRLAEAFALLTMANFHYEMRQTFRGLIYHQWAIYRLQY